MTLEEIAKSFLYHVYRDTYVKSQRAVYCILFTSVSELRILNSVKMDFTEEILSYETYQRSSIILYSSSQRRTFFRRWRILWLGFGLEFFRKGTLELMVISNERCLKLASNAREEDIGTGCRYYILKRPSSSSSSWLLERALLKYLKKELTNFRI